MLLSQCAAIDFSLKNKQLSSITNVWTARHHRTWRMTVSSSPISGRVDSVCLTLDFAPSDVAVPPELRQSDSLAQFKRRLKTHLFGLWDHSALWHWLLVNWRCTRNILTYLLTCGAAGIHTTAPISDRPSLHSSVSYYRRYLFFYFCVVFAEIKWVLLAQFDNAKMWSPLPLRLESLTNQLKLL